MTTPTTADTRRDYIRRIVDSAPPLSEKTRGELRELFRMAREANR